MLKIAPNVNVKWKLSELQKKALAMGLPISKEVTKAVEVYIGKPIGKLELLWRRGFISPELTKPPTDSECNKIIS